MKKAAKFLVLIILMSIYRPIINHFLPDLGENYATLLRKVLQAGTVIAYITKVKLWDKVGGLNKISMRSIGIMLPVLLLSFSTYLYGIKDTNLLGVLMLILITLLIGLIEELEFRGVIYTYLEEERTFTRILGSSVLFGLVHLLNLLYEPDLAGVIVQVFFATGIGMVFAVVRYKTNLLLPQLLMHALWDFNQKLTYNVSPKPLVEVLNYSALALVVLWGLYLVYGVMKEEKKLIPEI